MLFAIKFSMLSLYILHILHEKGKRTTLPLYKNAAWLGLIGIEPTDRNNRNEMQIPTASTDRGCFLILL